MPIYCVLGLMALAAAAPAAELPWTEFAGVVYDNDDHRDVYTDEYLTALAHNQEIELHALITTYSGDEAEYREFVDGRRRIVESARASGLQRIPDAQAGTSRRLARPSSNRIEDTQALDLPASRSLIEAAAQASADRPIVFVSGGQLTVVADAYLLDPTLAQRVVVSGLFGVTEKDYNAGLDSWAWTVVLSRFRTLAVPVGPSSRRGVVYEKPPRVPKRRIAEETPQGLPFFRWMFDKRHPSNPLPAEADYDGQAAIPLMRRDYITKVRRWRPAGIEENGNPRMVEDPEGSVFEALDADQSVATQEFWRAVGKAGRATTEGGR